MIVIKSDTTSFANCEKSPIAAARKVCLCFKVCESFTNFAIAF